MKNNLHTEIVFLDLTKAFVIVNHSFLLYKLEHYGIRGIINNFSVLFLTNRNQYVAINNTSNSFPKSIEIGVPHSSILEPLLFLLYINDIPNSLDCIPSLFADDTCLLMGAPFKILLTTNSNQNLKIVDKFSWHLFTFGFADMTLKLMRNSEQT